MLSGPQLFFEARSFMYFLTVVGLTHSKWKHDDTLQFSGTDSVIKSRWHQRRGRYCQVPHVGRSGTTAAQNLRLSSFAVHAPRLFNSLPDYIRNTTDCSLNVFKGLLDKFLASVPDEPLIRGYTAYRRADTNSLLDMVRFATAQSLPGLEEPDNISDAGGGHPWSP